MKQTFSFTDAGETMLFLPRHGTDAKCMEEAMGQGKRFARKGFTELLFRLKENIVADAGP